ncbi:cytochrome c-type biogenesis protein CcmE [Desulfosporosinus orientis DSM 765]|uniref:Cytochrome c-type biogenesis protein CcmE n=1 Tax=Desulfosporosinus orientis (strain ATCC 19365 / DSM 765 / NCIMB 8382 / VKM B-1628 / Singapore I) TaxID=768706 RepID=G7WAA6_DESOD|nr:cytochrome c maturation protein CcmE [Desulfosporosinus orientis]AET66244.1 cytochrome c-type biogenesis protein CcmE [Desulfosporosinus orientis DSM 765]
MRKKNLKLTAGILITVAAVFYLILAGLSTTNTAYYLMVSEAGNNGVDYGKHYRIEGQIDAASATFDGRSNPVELKFQIYDKEQPEKKLTVIYHDVKPDNFQEATAAVVEGKFNEDGTFQADNLNLKCPSKYEQADQTQPEGGVTKFLKSLGLKK